MPTSPATAWPAHFAKLFHDFIAAASTDTGIPAAGTLPRAHQESAATSKCPSLLVSCVPEKSAHRKLFKGQVQFRIRDDVKAGTPNTLGPNVIAAIEKRLLDDEAFAAFIVAKPEADRTGWQILKRTPLASVDVAVEGTEATRDWILPLDLTAIVQREYVPDAE